MTEEKKENYFEVLRKVQAPTEKIKMGSRELTYISWADAWDALKKIHPEAGYTIYTDERGIPYFSDASGCYVKVRVTVGDLEPGGDFFTPQKPNWGVGHEMVLPVLDHMNKPVKQAQIDSFQVNKAIMRCLAKAIAMHGLGLYVYRGEDFPEREQTEEDKQLEKEEKEVIHGGTILHECSDCKEKISEKVSSYSLDKFNKELCLQCQKKERGSS